ncbi:CHAD domain-containing protein [Ruficoccus amylovorans]|uniref:CHAD domain-containing protein n=1 Tax=Ruficoccus amylovorans TaxID=1804625 RepID=A0A842HAR3_9BACT|nr:CHAD domain-containing protein [Ruficoccus amylovorans]MBC2593573.1 CHAD domain-containing protein [Ruficoccus amylovorans]
MLPDFSPMKADTCILFDSETAEAACLESLGAQFGLEAAGASQSRHVYFDTFDWRLFAEGYGLESASGELRLCSLADDEVLAALPWKNRRAPAFASEVAEEGPLRDALAKVCGIRALLRQAELTAHLRDFRVLDAEGKTVLRVRFGSYAFHGGSKPFLREWRVRPLKGYEAEAREFCLLAGRYGKRQKGPGGHPLTLALQERGVDPFRYSPNRDLGFSPELPAYLAARSVLEHALEVVEANEPGILDDTDTEFLHHYRVALRQTKSALGLFGEVLPKKETDALKQTVGALARASNTVRDLDVFLLKRASITARLPGAFNPGVETFFRRLKAERRREFKKLCAFLRSEELPAGKLQWREFSTRLASPDFSPAPGVSVYTVACANISRRYARILKRGGKLGPGSPEEPFHELRIDFKKLRYNLEFFRSLFPGKEVGYFIRHLRRMQGLLGDLNDIKVQRDFLTARLARLDLKTRDSANIAASLGALIARLEEGSLRLREGFPAAFAELADGRMKSIAGRLFRPS